MRSSRSARQHAAAWRSPQSPSTQGDCSPTGGRRPFPAYLSARTKQLQIQASKALLHSCQEPKGINPNPLRREAGSEYTELNPDSELSDWIDFYSQFFLHPSM